MSNIEKIMGEFGTLMTGVETAQGQAAAAEKRAQEVTLQAAGEGFAAVAARLAQVQLAIGEIHGGLGGLAGSVGEAGKATAAVPREGSSEDTIAGLAPVRDGVGRIREAAAGTIAQVEDAQRLVSSILRGGQPGQMLSALEGIKQVLVLIVQRTDATGRLVDAACVKARQLGSSGN